MFLRSSSIQGNQFFSSSGLKEFDDTVRQQLSFQGTIPNFGFTLDLQLGSVRIEADMTPKTGLKT
jgi:hypothetical protein